MTAPAVRSMGLDFEAWIARHRLVLLAGMVCLVLAGGMVLRMLAISTPVPLVAGAESGLLYCAILIIVAERKYRGGSALHGDTFAVLAVLILDALLVEVTHRPEGFSRGTSYAVLAASVAILSALAVIRGRSAPFAVMLLAAPVTGLVLGGSPFLHPLFAGILALTVAAGQVGARWRSWGWARVGPAAIAVVYLLALGFIARATAAHDLPQHAFAGPLAALCIFAGFFALCVLPAAASTLFRARRLDALEITLALAVALTAFAGSAAVLLTFPSGRWLAGLAASTLAALFYTAAAASFARHGSESGGFYALSAIAGLYALAGLAFLLSFGAPLGTAYQALALGLASSATLLGKSTLSFQAHMASLVAFLVLIATPWTSPCPPTTRPLAWPKGGGCWRR
ncbi:MAG: hypothetical protein ACYTDY_20020, partial [Planctomycetota bacterium]